MVTADPVSEPGGGPRGVRWPQVAVLGLLQGAIGLSWIVYSLYLPALLIARGLDARLAVMLLTIEGLLAIVLEPTFGFLSDQSFRRIGTRLPFVVGGVFLAAALFIMIPLAVSTSAAASEIGRNIFLALLIGWAVAMTIFRAPALSLLSRYAIAPNLPRAASVLTLVGAGVAALRPTSREFLLSLGPGVCFGLASLVLLATCAGVWFIDRQVPASTPPAPGGAGGQFGAIATLVATGAGMALTFFALFTHLLPRLFGMLPRGGPDMGLLLAAAFLFFGASAVGAGAVAKKIGNDRAMLIGAGVTALLIALLACVSPTPLILLSLVAILLMGFSLVANGVIPLALSRVPAERGGLGVGFYFGGLSATSGLAATRFRAPVSVGEASAFALIGLAVIAAAIWAGRRPAGRP
jgi:Major Facilitator Superfamily